MVAATTSKVPTQQVFQKVSFVSKVTAQQGNAKGHRVHLPSPLMEMSTSATLRCRISLDHKYEKDKITKRMTFCSSSP
jgi:hypothetical protein